MDQQEINLRLGIMKVNFRVIIERLWRIIDYKWEFMQKYNE